MKIDQKTSRMFAYAGIFLLTTPLAQTEELIASWTFEHLNGTEEVTGSTFGPLSPEEGNGFAGGVHADEETKWSHPQGDGSAEAFSSNRWGIDDYYQFTVDTSGLSGITVSWKMYRSGTGPETWEFQYSADGLSFEPKTSFDLSKASSWSDFTEDLTTLADLNDRGTVAFRLVAMSSPSGSSGYSGTARVDDFTVTALSTIPEPSAYAAVFGAAALLWVVACRRRLVRG